MEVMTLKEKLAYYINISETKIYKKVETEGHEIRRAQFSQDRSKCNNIS